MEQILPPQIDTKRTAMSKYVIGTLVSMVLAATFGVNAYGQTAGRIADIRGDWTASGQVLRLGSSVAAGQSIANTSRSGSDLIFIVDRQGRPLLRRTCATDDCSARVNVPAPTSPGQLTAGIRKSWERFWDYFVGSSPGPRQPAMSRGNLIWETLAKMAGNTTDITSLFETLPSGDYHLIFKRTDISLTVPKKPGEPDQAKVDKRESADSLDVRVTWSEGDGNKAPILVKGLQPGLYEVAEQRSPVNTAWVLVLPTKSFTKAARDFAQPQRVTRQWTETGMDTRSIKKCLRIHLEFLAETYLTVGKN